jgi:hypothetical protein
MKEAICHSGERRTGAEVNLYELWNSPGGNPAGPQ